MGAQSALVAAVGAGNDIASTVITTCIPFGSNVSLDGVHPGAQGHSVLATAALQSINARYGLAIP